MSSVWMVCSACRDEIQFGDVYWECSVSTCNRNRTRLVFCTVACWDSHLGEARHREAWAVEHRAPTATEYARQQAEASASPEPTPAPAPAAPPRKVVAAAPPPPSGPTLSDKTERDVLIVVSKMKKYIKDRSGMNCSDNVLDGLSDHVRAVCDEAIRAAAADGRKTVLDRDVPRVVRR